MRTTTDRQLDHAALTDIDIDVVVTVRASEFERRGALFAVDHDSKS